MDPKPEKESDPESLGAQEEGRVPDIIVCLEKGTEKSGSGAKRPVQLGFFRSKFNQSCKQSYR